MQLADNICYVILDIEDGFRLGHVTEDQTRKLFAETAELSRQEAKRSSIERLRGLAIHQLVRVATGVFKRRETSIMAGSD